MSGNERHSEWQKMKNGNEWYNEWLRVIQRVTKSDNEWLTASDNEWSFQLILLFFGIIEEPNIKHFKENSLKLAEDLEDGILD